MSIAKLLVIGLDSANKDLMLHWAADGSLPHFSRLLESGADGGIHAAPGERREAFGLPSTPAVRRRYTAITTIGN